MCHNPVFVCCYSGKYCWWGIPIVDPANPWAQLHHSYDKPLWFLCNFHQRTSAVSSASIYARVSTRTDDVLLKCPAILMWFSNNEIFQRHTSEYRYPYRKQVVWFMWLRRAYNFMLLNTRASVFLAVEPHPATNMLLNVDVNVWSGMQMGRIKSVYGGSSWRMSNATSFIRFSAFRRGWTMIPKGRVDFNLLSAMYSIVR